MSAKKHLKQVKTLSQSSMSAKQIQYNRWYQGAFKFPGAGWDIPAE